MNAIDDSQSKGRRFFIDDIKSSSKTGPNGAVAGAFIEQALAGLEKERFSSSRQGRIQVSAVETDPVGRAIEYVIRCGSGRSINPDGVPVGLCRLIIF